MLLLHGFGANSEHWRACAPALAEQGYRVYALDLIGFGRSSQPGLHSGLTLDNRLWGRQVGAFIREVIGQPAVLIGNSLGGLTALTAAVLEPSTVLAVVAAPLPDPALITPVSLAVVLCNDAGVAGCFAASSGCFPWSFCFR